MMFKTLNNLSVEERSKALLRCCHSQNWVKKMNSNHPFSSNEEVHQKAIDVWKQMQTEDILEAFRGHPMIGADLDELRKKFQTTSTWSEGEQAGMQQASENVIRELRRKQPRLCTKVRLYFYRLCNRKNSRTNAEPHQRTFA